MDTARVGRQKDQQKLQEWKHGRRKNNSRRYEVINLSANYHQATSEGLHTPLQNLHEIASINFLILNVTGRLSYDAK